MLIKTDSETNRKKNHKEFKKLRARQKRESAFNAAANSWQQSCELQRKSTEINSITGNHFSK